MAFKMLRCKICGEPATDLVGKSAFMPVCENIVCEVTVLEQVNAALRELDAERIKFEELF